MPQEILAKITTPGGASKGAPGKDAAPAAAPTMTDGERMAATMDIMKQIGFQRGTPATPDQIEQAKKLAKEKKLDPDLIAARLATPGGRGGRSGGGGGDAGGGGRRGGGGAGANDRGFNNTVVERQVFKIADPAAPQKQITATMAKFGVSDGFFTEVIDGLADGDTLIRGVIMPGASAAMQPPGGMQNPFQGSSGRGGFGGSSGGMRGGR
jgi:uncharacterized membrane protein YgcG